MSGSTGRGVSPERLERLAALGRELSGVTVMLHTRIAEHLGLSATDHKCLDLAMRAEGPLTAGRIAELSGLSTGAVTGVIDRLERAGYVSRIRDPGDRRKVLVKVNQVDEKKLERLFGGLRTSLAETASHYTDDQLAIVEDYLGRTVDRLRKEISRVAKLDR